MTTLIRRLVPFQGTFFWEMQVGPFVLQMRRVKGKEALRLAEAGLHLPLFAWFIDPHWADRRYW
jgi:hypothetical protein